MRSYCLLILFAVLFAIPQLGRSQNHFGQFCLSVSATHNPLRVVHKIPFSDYKKKFNFVPGQQAQLDFTLLRFFDVFAMSLGMGYTNQKHELKIYDYQYITNGQLYIEDPVQRIRTGTFSLRGLIHLVGAADDDLFDLYFGGGTQYYFFKTSSNSGDPDFYQDDDEFSTPQFIAGARCMPLPWLGVGSEFTFPGAAMFSLGICFMFNNN
ncbi:MAG: hypothetical protein EP338_14360 [Bacteroidetes bacterium]|nr:MAG: hypothetical protein EP338_14360 [Bacteroidota bacterium]